MPDALYILKISYKPRTITKIVSEEALTYEVVLDFVFAALKVCSNVHKYFEIRDDGNNVFDKNSFNHYLQLFPISKRLFYVKFNSKLMYEDQINNDRLQKFDIQRMNTFFTEEEIKEFVLKRKSKTILEHQTKKRKLDSGQNCSLSRERIIFISVKESSSV